jgi:hypothetical protein
MELVIDFKNIINNLKINYINNLIKSCEKNNINKDLLEEKLDKLKLDESPKEIKIMKSLNSTDSPSGGQFSDDYLYQKPWTKLTAIHKIIKIKEFVNNLQIKNEGEKQKIKDKLVELIKNKTLTKKESVIYDFAKAKIISINALKFIEGKYEI